MTISQLAKEKTGNFKDYEGLLEWLLECVDDPDDFAYQHVIVDEGQDFGLIDGQGEANDVEANCSIIDTLQEISLEKNGTFYLFYDKYQMIQGGGKARYKIPDCIENSDCRLTLHYNCRNTKEIAKTSVTPLKDNKNRAIKPKTACSWFEPVRPVMHLVGGEKKAVKKIYACMKEAGFAGGKVRIGHTYNDEAVESLTALIRADFPDCDIRTRYNRGLCCFYAEEGGFLIGFEG